MRELKNKVVVITGAASGIGRALADRFAAEGSKIVLADIEPKALEEAAAELRVGGATVLAVPTDVSRPEQVQGLCDRTVAEFGRVDVVCNNAGVAVSGLAWEHTLADWEWVLGVNLWGVIHGVHAFLPVFRRQGTAAHIVNTASIAGLLSGVAFIGPYSATKVAVVSISETLVKEFAIAQLPIGVSVLCPSSVATRVMESERSRPPALGVEHRTELAEADRLGIRDSFTGPTGLTPAHVAQRVMDAIREDRFWIVTHPGERPQVEERFAAALAAFP